MNKLEQGISKIKAEFSSKYKGGGQLHEIVPLESSDIVQIQQNQLNMLHKFAQSNPIYFNSFEESFLEVPCMVYEADINQYWLNSIKHDASYQSFYPTWILSAFALALVLKKYGFTEAIDIGSGDGRIAYCTQLVGIKSFGIEIDEELVRLQQDIANNTKVSFDAKNADAIQFDYSSLELNQPAFFISGLPEMGGEMLADGVIPSIKNNQELKNHAAFLFMGKTPKGENKNHGWEQVIKNFDLQLHQTISLPTHWTTDQTIDTPHLFTSFSELSKV